MINILKFEGKEKEIINEQIVKELNTTLDDLIINYEFIEGKLFKSSKYIASVIKKDDLLKFINETIKTIGNYMNIVIDTEILESDNIYNITLVSNNNGVLIGKDGKTLNSIQTIVRQIVKSNTHSNIKLNLDVANYKIKKMKNIERLAKEVAKEVLSTKVTVALDPMNSYERRLVHTIISEYKNLKTESVGEGRDRHITIIYEED